MKTGLLMAADRAKPALVGDTETLDELERRLGRLHARQRLGIETDHEKQIAEGRRGFFQRDSAHRLIRGSLRAVGLYRRAQRNAARIEIRENILRLPRLPAAFDGFTILHISDLHVDMSAGAMRRLREVLPTLRYDLCALTGDYRGKTFGPFEATLDGMAQLCAVMTAPSYGVLGNHDSLRMVPGLEAMGIRMLMNEAEPLRRGNQAIYVAGIDDAHFYQVHNIEKAAADIPQHAFSILLSHTPEVYRQAAYAGFDLMLSGHTHGGQICLPRSVPVILDADLPRHMGAEAWEYRGMSGYTSVGAGSSVVAVRLNCSPAITLHRLQRG